MEQIITFLEKKTGFLFDDRKKEALSSIIRRRVDAINAGSSEHYLAYIGSQKGAAELVELIGCITVGETYFLRNKQDWRAFNEFVLPMIVDSKRGKKRTIKIWSAGCSTGEETYSIAVAILESLLFFQNWDIKITGTDINETFLERAREGAYTKNAFRGVDGKWIEKWFTKGKGGYRIANEVRKMVEFSRLNLISENGFPLAFTDLDIIFCRNVLMYFRPEAHTRVFKQFSECLKPGGFLFLGYAEGAMAPRDIFEAKTCCDTPIFQKRGECGMQNGDFGLNKARTAQTKNRKTLKNENGSAWNPKSKSKLFPQKDAKTRNGKVLDQTIAQSENRKSKSGDPHSYEIALDYYYQQNFGAALKVLPENDIENVGLKELILKTMIQVDSSDLVNAEISLQELQNRSNVLPEVHVLEAMIKEAKGDYDGAVKACLAAIFLDKVFFVPQFRLAHIRFGQQGDAKTAVRHFHSALRCLERDREERVMLFSGGVSKELLADICRKRLKDFGL